MGPVGTAAQGRGRLWFPCSSSPLVQLASALPDARPEMPHEQGTGDLQGHEGPGLHQHHPTAEGPGWPGMNWGGGSGSEGLPADPRPRAGDAVAVPKRGQPSRGAG